MNQNDLVSIILPVYNAERFIENTIRSVLNQTYSNIECVVIDDGSTDSTAIIVNNIRQNDCRIKYYKQQNGGICSARNLGLDKINGQYVCFCDHDDEYDRKFIENSISLIRSLNVDVICSAYKEIEIRGSNIIKEETRIPQNTNIIWDASNIFCDYVTYQHTFTTIWNCLYTRDAVTTIKFDNNLKFGGEDILFNLTILQRGYRVGKNEKVAYYHYKRYGQSTSCKINNNRIQSLLICLNEEVNMVSNDMDEKKYLIATCEQYYLGGIIKLIKENISMFSYSRFKTLIKSILHSQYYEWRRKYINTSLGVKYKITYYLFCKLNLRLLYFLCKIC